MIPHADHPRPLSVLALFAALVLLWSWPLPLRLASRVAFDPGDPFLNTWILWWNAQVMPFSTAWWNPPVFHPMPGALALSEHLAGIAVFTTPLIALGPTPALAYNVALLLSGALSGFFTYLLVWRLTGSSAAAICAGLAYAFAPFRAGQLSHLQVLTSQWLPLMLLGLHGYLESGRRRWLVMFAAAWLLQSLSNGYYLLFAPVLIGAWLLWFAIAGRRWRPAAAIAGAWIAASLALLPMLLTYHRVHQALGLSRPLGEIRMFSGHLSSFLKPPPMLRFWPESPLPAAEDFLFPGFTIVLLVLLSFPAAAGLVMRRRQPPAGRPLASPFLFYVSAALLMAALTFGPAAPGEGLAGWLRPYQWLMLLPGFDGVRVPARFGMLMALCLAVAGGLGLAAVMPAGAIGRRLLAGVVAAGLLADGAIDPLTGSPPPGRVEAPAIPAAAVLELPPDDTAVSVGAMFRSMSHGLPLVNGYSGHIPPHYDILGQSLRRDDPSAIVELARGRSLLILVAARNDPAGDFRRLVERIPGIERHGVTGAGAAYVLPPQPAGRRPRGGTAVPFVPQFLPREHAILDLGAARVVRTLEFPVGDRYEALGRRIAVEVSLDGESWTMGWEDWTGGLALAGALEDQRTIPVRIVLPDVEARFLRIHPAPDWLVGGLRVLEP